MWMNHTNVILTKRNWTHTEKSTEMKFQNRLLYSTVLEVRLGLPSERERRRLLGCGAAMGVRSFHCVERKPVSQTQMICAFFCMCTWETLYRDHMLNHVELKMICPGRLFDVMRSV